MLFAAIPQWAQLVIYIIKILVVPLFLGGKSLEKSPTPRPKAGEFFWRWICPATFCALFRKNLTSALKRRFRTETAMGGFSNGNSEKGWSVIKKCLLGGTQVGMCTISYKKFGSDRINAWGCRRVRKLYISSKNDTWCPTKFTDNL